MIGWLREWLTLPARWRKYRDELRSHDKHRNEFNRQAVQLGYAGRDYLESAVDISRRCAGAEWELKRLAALRERERKQRARELDQAGLPGLSAAEIERLAMLAEECGSLAEAVATVLRHGWDRESPFTGRTNRIALEREMGSMRAVVGLMLDSQDVHLGELQGWQRSRRAALGRWTYYQACSISREEQLEAIREISEARLERCQDKAESNRGEKR